MAFSFDSGPLVSGLGALALFAAALFAWTRNPRASIRVNLRFAAVLFAALAVSGLAASLSPDFSALGLAVAALVAGLGAAALGLCCYGFLLEPPPPLAAGLGLSAGLALGLLACLSGQMMFALATVMLPSATMIALGSRALSATPHAALRIMLGAISLMGGGLALMEQALGAALLFFAAGLMGLACALEPLVEKRAAASLVRLVR